MNSWFCPVNDLICCMDCCLAHIIECERKCCFRAKSSVSIFLFHCALHFWHLNIIRSRSKTSKLHKHCVWLDNHCAEQKKNQNIRAKNNEVEEQQQQEFNYGTVYVRKTELRQKILFHPWFWFVGNLSMRKLNRFLFFFKWMYFQIPPIWKWFICSSFDSMHAHQKLYMTFFLY